jgi:hypothetical protein
MDAVRSKRACLEHTRYLTDTSHHAPYTDDFDPMSTSWYDADDVGRRAQNMERIYRTLVTCGMAHNDWKDVVHALKALETLVDDDTTPRHAPFYVVAGVLFLLERVLSKLGPLDSQEAGFAEILSRIVRAHDLQCLTLLGYMAQGFEYRFPRKMDRKEMIWIARTGFPPMSSQRYLGVIRSIGTVFLGRHPDVDAACCRARARFFDEVRAGRRIQAKPNTKCGADDGQQISSFLL